MELDRASARVTCLLTLDRERVAEMHVPLIYMAFVAIRLPQLGGFTAKNTCQRDDERKAFHPAPPRNYPRPTPPRRRGVQRNDAVVCSEQTMGSDGGGRGRERRGRAAGRLMESDRNFKNKTKDDNENNSPMVPLCRASTERAMEDPPRR